MADSPAPSTDTMTYEEARDELVKVVGALEAGGATLTDTMAMWQRGEQLADVCQAHLDGAQATLDKASQTPENDDA